MRALWRGRGALVRFHAHLGFCVTCRRRTVFTKGSSRSIDEPQCLHCGSGPRERSLIAVVDEAFPNWRDLRIHEISPKGTASALLARDCGRYTSSHLLEGEADGELDLLSVGDESLDLVISQDLMDRVRDPGSALSEICRVLRPGGAHIFTVRMQSQVGSSVTAEQGPDRRFQHVRPPRHRDPDGRRTVVVPERGRDVCDFVQEHTDMAAVVVSRYGRRLGLEGEFLHVCVSQRPAQAGSVADLPANRRMPPVASPSVPSLLPLRVRRLVTWARLVAAAAGSPIVRLRHRASQRRVVDALQACRTARRCFIVGNGPSLNNQDLTQLAGEDVWTVNRGHLLWPHVSWTPAVHIVQDKLTLEENRAEISDIVDANPRILFVFPDVDSLRARAPRSNVVLCPIRWVDAFAVDEIPSISAGSLPPNGVSGMYTVIATAIQLAAAAGYDEIILLGCDNTYFGAAKDEAVAVDAVSGTATMVATSHDADHFSTEYRRLGERWYAPRAGAHDRSFDLAGRAVAAAGVLVRNATAGGSLEVFERVRFDDLFGGAHCSEEGQT